MKPRDIQPSRLIVLFCQGKPQMPVVKQQPDPFFGFELRGRGHCSETIAVTLLFKEAFSWGGAHHHICQSIMGIAVRSINPTALSSFKSSVYRGTPPFSISRPLTMHMSIFLNIFCLDGLYSTVPLGLQGLINSSLHS